MTPMRSRDGIRWARTGLLLVLLLLPAAAAQAQERGGVRYDGRLSAETVERLQSMEARAQRAGVPAELFRRKVNEGVSKGVTGPRLERAIDAYVTRLSDAVRLAGPGAAPDVLEAAAGAAERGVPPDRIRSFLTVNPNPQRSVPGLSALADLVEAGVPEGQAARGVNAALDRGMRGERLLAFSAAVRRRVGAGEDPTEALRRELGDR